MGVKLGPSHSGRETVFENRVLREVFGPKRNEITREWS
jgi:hypothetical protein